MKILIIELCNYIDQPIGGQLSFARHMISAFGQDLQLVGIVTSVDTPVGQWCKKEIDGKIYEFFAVCRVENSSKRPLVPARLSGYFALRKHMKKILQQPYDRIFIQSCETLFALPKNVLSKCVMCIPGLANPLSISRYFLGKCLAPFYDMIYFPKLRHVSKILAAADRKEIAAFVKRSNTCLQQNQVISFPTRYDGNLFKHQEQAAARATLLLSPTGPMVVTVGRIGWFKGWKFMLDAFILFKEMNPTAQFYYIGDGEDHEAMQRYIEENKLQNACTLTGRKQPLEIATYLNAADLFIMGSFFEGWSTTLVEACACGIPAVVTDFSSAEEMICNGENGFVIKQRDEKLFAQKMHDCLKIPRQHIVAYDKRYEVFALSNLKSELLRIME